MLPTAAIALYADYAVTLDVAERTEVRARTTQVVQSTPGTSAAPATLAFDLFAQPRAALNVRDRVWHFTLSYSPAFTAPDLLGESPSLQLFHMASAGVSWHERRVRLSLFEDASYGALNSAYLPTTPTSQAPQPVASTPLLTAPQTLQLGSSNTTFVATTNLTRRAIASADAGYSLAGGVDASSRAALPLLFGPRAGASLSYAVSRTDRWITAATGQHLDSTIALCPPPVTGVVQPQMPVTPAALDCQPESDIVQGSESWSHRFSRSTTMVVGAGVSAAESRLTHHDPYQKSVFPTGTFSFARRFGNYGLDSVSLDVGLYPVVDPRFGTVSEWVQGQLSSVWRLNNRVTLRFGGGGVQTLPASDPLATTMIHGELEASYRVDRHVLLSLGESGAWQDQLPYSAFFSTFGYFAVTVQDRALKSGLP